MRGLRLDGVVNGEDGGDDEEDGKDHDGGDETGSRTLIAGDGGHSMNLR